MKNLKGYRRATRIHRSINKLDLIYIKELNVKINDTFKKWERRIFQFNLHHYIFKRDISNYGGSRDITPF